jgi:hypothetical protein
VIVSRRFGIVHGLATCRDCGWHTEQYKNAQANAARHASAHGHTVIVEIGMAGTYVGAKK